MTAAHVHVLQCESGGDNLAANFSNELADYTIYVIDVAGTCPALGKPYTYILQDQQPAQACVTCVLGNDSANERHFASLIACTTSLC